MKMEQTYDPWLTDVKDALLSISMPMDAWQQRWRYNFDDEFRAGIAAAAAADKANRFWWREQNKAIGHGCTLTPDCWLPWGHSGECGLVA